MSMSNWAAFWVKLLDMIDEDDCTDICVSKVTDILQYINLIK